MNLTTLGFLTGGLGLLLLARHYLVTGAEGVAGMFRRETWPRLARQRAGAACAGMVFGLLQQSAPAAGTALLAYQATGLLASGPALAALTAAHLGAALTCLLLVIPPGPQAWLPAGAAALLYLAVRGGRFRHTGLLLLGLAFTAAAATLLQAGWSDIAGRVAHVTALTATGGLWRCLLCGLLAAFCFRSTFVVFALTGTLWAAGGLTFAAAAVILLGELAGGALAVWLAAPAGNGDSRRSALAHLVVIMLCVLPALYVLSPALEALAAYERQWCDPLTLAPRLLAILGMGNLALVALLPRLGAAAVGLLLSLAAGTQPAAGTAAPSPLTVTALARQAPESALDFLAHDLAQLAGQVPALLEFGRQGLAGNRPDGEQFAAQQRVLAAAGARIEEGLSALTNRDLSPESARRLINLAHRQQALASITGQVQQFAAIAAQREYSDTVAGTIENFLEALDALLLTMSEATQRPQVGEIGMLLSATENRGATLERIRALYLAGEQTPAAADRAALLGIINHFEICAWSLHRYGELLFAAQTD